MQTPPQRLIPLLACLALPALFAQDTQAPVLAALTITPSSVNVGAGPAQVTVEARITDNLSGFGSGFVQFTSPSQISDIGGDFSPIPISGTILNGTFRALVTVPQAAEAGVWSVLSIQIRDVAGNNSPVFYAPDLQAQGFPTNLTVVSPSVASLTSSPASLQFSAPVGGTAPTQTLTISAGASTLNMTATASSVGNWLTVTPGTGSTPVTLTISVNTAALTAANYTGSIIIAAAGASNSPLVVPITLTVGTPTGLQASPSQLSFAYVVGGTLPPSQSLTLSFADDATRNFTVAPPTAPWLSLTPTSGTTPDTVTVSLVAAGLAGLAAGTHSSNLVVTPAGGLAPITVAVNLTVNSTPILSVPGPLSFAFQLGGPAPATKPLTISSNGPAGTFAATATSSGGWLAVSPASGQLPATLTVSVNQAGLAAGTYSGSINVTSAGFSNSPLTVPVTLTVTAAGAVGLTVTPSSLSFAYQVANPVPPAQNLALTTSDGSARDYTVTAPVTWVGVSPSSGTTPATLRVSVGPISLTPGNYSTTLTITPTGGTPITVPVSLLVSTTPIVALAASPTSVSFAHVAGAAPPSSQSVALSSGDSPLSFTASVASTATWLTATPASGSTPANLTLAVNPAGLTPGTYTGTITITAAGVSNPLSITVTLTVTTPLPTITAIVNAASYAGGRIAAGEIVTIFGREIGPSLLTTLRLTPEGKFADVLADTRIFFNGVAAPLVYVQREQASAIVPYSVAGRSAAFVEVVSGNRRSSQFVTVVSNALPGIFTADASGRGQAAALNEDSSLNTSANPAKKGSVVVIYATGEGETNPPGVDGKIADQVFPKPLGPVLVKIGDMDAEVLYAGAAPGLVAGVLQVNARVPRDAASGAVPIQIVVGGVVSQTAVTISVE